ncbi:MAG: hypothetical protein AAFN94_17665, partial [Pseudomonadota bacterium]
MPHPRLLRATAVALSLLAVPAGAIDQDPDTRTYYIVSAPLTKVLSLITTDTGVDIDFDPDRVPYVTST